MLCCLHNLHLRVSGVVVIYPWVGGFLLGVTDHIWVRLGYRTRLTNPWVDRLLLGVTDHNKIINNNMAIFRWISPFKKT
jgi:hypothetical protein